MKPTKSGDSGKEEMIKRRHFALRLNVFFFCTFIVFSVLIVRLALLQFVEGPQMKSQESQTTTKSISIAPPRGNIYDRSGFAIAYSTSSQAIFYRIEPNQKKDEVVALAKQLADIFAQYGDKSQKAISAEDVIKKMDVGYDLQKNITTQPNYFFSPRIIKTNLTDQEIAYILEHRDVLKGVEIAEQSDRHYWRNGTQQIAVQLVGYLRQFSTARNQKNSFLDFYKNPDEVAGYIDSEDVGFDGLEFMFQKELRGKNGFKSYPINSLQQIIGPMTITKPEKGNNLYLTIDKDVQLAAQAKIMQNLDYMKSQEAKINVYAAMGAKAKAGYAVAMEVKTGRVIAMASMPDYDPNLWSGGILPDDYNMIQPFINNGTITTAYPDYSAKELLKHPNSLVPLGSTMKPLSVLIGLKEGLITAGEKYMDTGTFYFGKDNKSHLTNSDTQYNGPINAVTAITLSSNTYMAAMIGNRLYLSSRIKKPLDLWDSYMEKFGLGVVTGSGLPNESKGIKEYFNEVKTGSLQSALVYAAFGQQGKYTVLQLAQYAATLANRGKRPKPLFVDKITDSNNNIVENPQPEFLPGEDSFSKASWDLIQQGMIGVSQRGNVLNVFKDFPYQVATKTGTSQQSVAGKLLDNAVFIAYAPADNPTLAVAVVVPEGGFGAYGAAPIARAIFDAYDAKIGLTGKPNPNAPIFGSTSNSLLPPGVLTNGGR